jgi:hypothetical protein
MNHRPRQAKRDRYIHTRYRVLILDRVASQRRAARSRFLTTATALGSAEVEHATAGVHCGTWWRGGDAMLAWAQQLSVRVIGALSVPATDAAAWPKTRTSGVLQFDG